ncbi:MAG TPA: hypothetical protein VMG08_08300 [Allosphingosinicella sp.]|nr:hypothetical protein [Allosphingosinicella sp.]
MRRGRAVLAAALILAPSAPAMAGQGGGAAPLAERVGLNLSPRLCALTQSRLDLYPDRLLAAYGLPGGATFTVSVIPIAQPLVEEFADTERTIAGLYDDVFLLRELPSPPGVAGARGRLWRGGDTETGPVVTGLWLWHSAGARVRVRVTFTVMEQERVWPEIECAVRALTAAPSV